MFDLDISEAPALLLGDCCHETGAHETEAVQDTLPPHSRGVLGRQAEAHSRARLRHCPGVLHKHRCAAPSIHASQQVICLLTIARALRLCAAREVIRSQLYMSAYAHDAPSPQFCSLTCGARRANATAEHLDVHATRDSLTAVHVGTRARRGNSTVVHA